jgi:hypothetical protein
MTRIKYTLVFCFCGLLLAAQEQASINSFNFESTTNPAFSLLEETPTQINTPDNIRALGVYLSNGFSNNNIAVEVNPYWLVDLKKQRSYERFRGIKTNKKGEFYIDPFIGIKTNTSISMGYLDKKFEGFDDEKKVAALGLRTTLLQFYNSNRLQKIKSSIKKIEEGVQKPLNQLFEEFLIASDLNLPASGSCESIDESYSEKIHEEADAMLDRIFEEQDPDDPDEIAEKGMQILLAMNVSKKEDITKEFVVAEYLEERCNLIEYFVANNAKAVKPIFRLDAALGYSILFKENEFNASTANRFGSWFTADFAVKFNDQDYLHIYGISRYIDNGFNINSEGMYFGEDFWDVGGKLELELKKLKFSYEYLRRTNGDNKFRSVGNITYQLNKKINITGGFGKDFQVEDNLVTILGINWGLDIGEGLFSN